MLQDNQSLLCFTLHYNLNIVKRTDLIEILISFEKCIHTSATQSPHPNIKHIHHVRKLPIYLTIPLHALPLLEATTVLFSITTDELRLF